MPEDTKTQGKNKNGPKEQRKRRGRQSGPENKQEKESETVKPSTKAPEKSEKPTYEPPPPEFYKNLKKETDEILKITEEANSKYKKKEILSNWAKYEMPIESYEEIDEQENLGADYETLANMPLSIGGHFQFKHEKSWDENSGPSPYDKYFDINMENLYTALSSIPFFERNNIDQSIFSETDIQNMTHRAMKFKQKYYNDKKYMTPDMEAQEKILKTLTLHDDTKYVEATNDKEIDVLPEINSEKKDAIMDNSIDASHNIKIQNIKEPSITLHSENDINELSENTEPQILKEKDNLKHVLDLKDNINVPIKKDIEVEQHNVKMTSESKVTALKPKNPVIESPEDLEKWLDDFLDG
ncbi:uncharacterized protein LOC123715541 [Pieris brassicae]|uniref:uncharacterized protein LOC123715541 n=1 Tax=Pieris brassicae TaxID=7116 RepID=UPI001E65FB97|nr:uncharacterized protein LOC123715541 [Pieris brassicae]